MRDALDKVIFLSGTTRGGTLEGIGRAFAPVLQDLGVELVEVSLLDMNDLLDQLRGINFQSVRFVLSCVGMGMDLAIQKEGREVSLWQELGVPFITLHGDSPAYFFDRHVVRSSNFISLYAFAEQCELRRRLPNINGPIAVLPPIVLDEIPRDEIDIEAKKNGTLIFLKNGKNPNLIRGMWEAVMEPRPLRALLEIADQLEANLDDPASNQIDDVVMRYFESYGLDIENLRRLRLFFIAQLDDYLRAVKCTRMAEALMDFPVEIRGNNWDHVDFSKGKAKYIDDCDYVESIGLIRNSLGTIDMSANTGSMPHDRVMRAFGAKTLCLTNHGQTFFQDLPHRERLNFCFEKECLQTRVNDLLSNKAAAVEMGIEVSEAFKRLNPPERSFEKMLDYAAMAKLDQLSHRPGAMQDFFVWPPRLL
ncbi:hypothetical protein [Granulicella sibirica]|uniref:Uncharacterized protein n=1 Tax=Granulicella sibirica TaxID=2479048 RepID=A0A4Q0T6G8_9BACT|nr:hypothetical protein [Granulicella sibirica]RXH57226.1 hypothetical protein GRAN_0536 [Granulicella sibirica]